MRASASLRTAIFAALLGPALTACSVSSVDIEGRDTGVPVPVLRLSAVLGGRPLQGTLLPERASRAESVDEHHDEATVPRTGGVKTFGAVDLELSTARGKFDHDFEPGEILSIGGEFLSEPGPIDVELDIFNGIADVRGGVTIKDVVSLEGFVGLWVGRVQYELETPTQRTSRDDTNVGPILGVQIGFYPTWWFGAYARGSFAQAVDNHIVYLATFETGASFALYPGVVAFGGWTAMQYREDITGSDTEVDFSGPVFGLHLSF